MQRRTMSGGDGGCYNVAGVCAFIHFATILGGVATRQALSRPFEKDRL